MSWRVQVGSVIGINGLRVIDAGTFFVPGPTEVRPEILEAMRRPMIFHRSPAMEELMRRVTARLAPIFGTRRPVHVVTGSGTSAMELAIRNGTRRKVLSIVHGDFGERRQHVRYRDHSRHRVQSRHVLAYANAERVE